MKRQQPAETTTAAQVEQQEGPRDDTASHGVALGLVAALPALAPALAATCASCVGIGIAAGIGASAAVPSPGWLAATVAIGVGLGWLARRRAAACGLHRSRWCAVCTLLGVALVAYGASTLVVTAALEILAGGSSAGGGPAPAPTLP